MTGDVRLSALALLGGTPVRSAPFPSWPVFDAREEQRLLQTLRSGRWGRLQGTETEEFEKRFAHAHGCDHGIATANGSVSLRIALLALGIRADDEVIIPPYTFVATATAVIEANAIPVFADVDLHTFNIDPAAVERAITPRTRAIVPVHFAGQPADMARILDIAHRHGLPVLEDAAHAHGAQYRCQPAGSLGSLASFSFQSSKNMTAGEGGIIVTNDARLAEACRSIHNCGRKEGGLWYEHHVISGNYRMGEFQAAVLNCQLDRLEEQTERRDGNGRYLAARLSSVPGLHPQARPDECTRHSYHLFMLRFDAKAFGAARHAVVDALAAEGIPTLAGYGFPLPHQPLFRDKAFGPYLPHAAARLDYATVAVPHSERLCRDEAVWIEQGALLGSRDDMDDIVRAFEKVHHHRHDLTRAAHDAR